jgi:hypothetical protein
MMVIPVEETRFREGTMSDISLERFRELQSDLDKTGFK